MRRLLFILSLIIGHVAWGFAQPSARQVLNKAAETVSNKQGVSAKFTITSANIGSTSGTISVKGNKFQATTPVATIWFDGKTQWTYMKNNDEVNVSNPTEAQLQAINPYNFINLYRNGFSYTMTTKGNAYEVHLTATNKKRSVQEMYITVNKSTYVPTQVKMKQTGGWTTINISNFKATKLSDNLFRFNSKDYPHAEVIDLR
ncbi:MAG: outer-membrane lipoprotein carrier protein LolA [Prevotella sp.]|nr:outer-membrane lipoprotein carrier protein LolA [Prevotella sp.]